MSMLYLAQPEQQQRLEWIAGGCLALLLDSAATDGQLMMGRFDVAEGEAPPYHEHSLEDEHRQRSVKVRCSSCPHRSARENQSPRQARRRR